MMADTITREEFAAKFDENEKALLGEVRNALNTKEGELNENLRKIYWLVVDISQISVSNDEFRAMAPPVEELAYDIENFKYSSDGLGPGHAAVLTKAAKLLKQLEPDKMVDKHSSGDIVEKYWGDHLEALNNAAKALDAIAGMNGAMGDDVQKANAWAETIEELRGILLAIKHKKREFLPDDCNTVLGEINVALDNAAYEITTKGAAAEVPNATTLSGEVKAARKAMDNTVIAAIKDEVTALLTERASGLQQAAGSFLVKHGATLDEMAAYARNNFGGSTGDEISNAREGLRVISGGNTPNEVCHGNLYQLKNNLKAVVNSVSQQGTRDRFEAALSAYKSDVEPHWQKERDKWDPARQQHGPARAP